VTGGWIGLFRALGESLLGVLRAELAALQADLARSGRHVRNAVVLFGATAALAFWVVGLLIFVAVAVVALWLPLWGAAASVLGVLVVVGILLGGWGYSQIKKVENPVDSARRRFDDHLDWWQNRLLASDTEEDEP
jgi:uncharacterized membrane protein YqjE